jgi:hypothetical protein
MWSCLVAFVSGALAEGVCTKWVQAVASQKPVSAGFLSTAWAALILLGIGESLHQGSSAVAWVAGHGLGSYLVVKWFRGSATKQENRNGRPPSF